MRNKGNLILVILLISFSFAALYYFYSTLKEKESLFAKFYEVKNDREFLNFQQEYLLKLINNSGKEDNKIHNFNNIEYFEILDGNKKSANPLTGLINSGKKKIFIRYTEIGCNSCADSTFKYLSKYKSLSNQYDIIVLVDFSNIDAYLKWKKVAEILYPIFWVKKGQLPFEIEKENHSYIFTVNKNSEVNNFFIPDSKFPKFIDTYFKNLELK